MPVRQLPANDLAAVRDLAAERGAGAESLRRLDDDVSAALVRAGFARHLVPSRWGGTEGTFGELVDAVTTVGEGCASAAWCGALHAIYGRMCAHLPLDGQEMLWADGPDIRIVGSVTPAGRVEPTAGGWRLTGEWTFTSGVTHADWAVLGGLAGGDPRYFLVPRADFRIVETWFNVGLRGTGSNTVVVEDAVVPAALSYPVADLWQGRGPSSAGCHTVPFKAVNGLSFVAPILGSARGALDSWSAWIAAKVDGAGRRARDGATVQLALARSSGEIDAAGLLLARAAATADAGGVTPAGVVRNTRDFSVAAELLSAAVDRLFRAGGARAQTEANVLQRAWRDVNCGAGHFALSIEHNAAAYAVHQLGA